MKKRKTFTRLLCAAVSVATVATVGGMALADETDVAEVEETELIVEEQPEAEEIEAEAVTEETETEVIPEESGEAETPEDEITAEVEVAEDEVIMDVIADEVIEPEEVTVSEEVIEVEEETVIFEEAEAVKNGWKKENGKWYYYQDGELVTGWQKIDGKWYYFDLSDAYMITGGLIENDKFYVFGTDGAMLTGLTEFEGRFFYLTASGAKRGWVKIDNKWYYFNDVDEDPYMLMTTIKTIGEYTYIFDENGVMQTGWVQPYSAYSGSYTPTYYCDADGHMVTGWLKLDGKWYYLDPVRAEGFRTFYDEVSGEKTDYFFDENGVMQTGWVSVINYMSPYRKAWYYFGSNGVAANGWTKIGNKWYYFNDGCVVTGSKTIEGKTYYFGEYLNQDGSVNSNVGVMCTGWRSARSQTGPYEFTTRWYYYGSDGAMVTGWKKIDNKWYYFDEESYNTGVMAVGMCSIRNSKSGAYEGYCFSSSGVMQTNHWERYGRTWCYFGNNGIQVYGWQQIKGSWYFFDEGYMVTGLVWMNGVLFDFGTNGACVNPPSDPSLYYIEHEAFK